MTVCQAGLGERFGSQAQHMIDQGFMEVEMTG
jgi:hypothetical protein